MSQKVLICYRWDEGMRTENIWTFWTLNILFNERTTVPEVSMLTPGGLLCRVCINTRLRWSVSVVVLVYPHLPVYVFGFFVRLLWCFLRIFSSISFHPVVCNWCWNWLISELGSNDSWGFTVEKPSQGCWQQTESLLEQIRKVVADPQVAASSNPCETSQSQFSSSSPTFLR